MIKTTTKPPSIFSRKDYRLYLKAWLRWSRKDKDQPYAIALKDNSYLLGVIKGERTLDSESIWPLAGALGLWREETVYLMFSVRYVASDNKEERRFLSIMMNNLKERNI